MMSNGDQVGEQIKLAWFRAIYGSMNESWRARQQGLPALRHIGEVGLISKKTWALVSSKGKVAQRLLKRILSKSFSSNDTMLLHSNDLTVELVDRHVTAMQAVSERLGVGSDIAAWILQYPTHETGTVNSPLSEVWLKKVGKPILNIP